MQASGNIKAMLMADAEWPYCSFELHSRPKSPFSYCGCGMNVVRQLEAEERGLGLWYVEFGCPNCGHSFKEMCGVDDLELCDEDEDVGVKEIRDDLVVLAKHIFAEEIRVFCDRLKSGLITPDDF